VDIVRDKYIIVFGARSGSHLLRSLLNSHPDVVCDNELFLHNDVRPYPENPFAYIESNKAVNASAPVYGYKLSLHQIYNMKHMDDSNQFLARMQQNGWSIIYIYRSDIVRQAVSLLKVLKTNIAHISKGDKVPYRKVSMGIAEICSTIYSLQFYRKREERLLKKIPHLRINYEHDLMDPAMHQITANKVFNFLNIPYAEVSTDCIPTSGPHITADMANGRIILPIAKIFSLLINPLVRVREAMLVSQPA
jgi:LPS sulfotransferase NodH